MTKDACAIYYHISRSLLIVEDDEEREKGDREEVDVENSRHKQNMKQSTITVSQRAITVKHYC